MTDKNCQFDLVGAATTHGKPKNHGIVIKTVWSWMNEKVIKTILSESSWNSDGTFQI